MSGAGETSLRTLRKTHKWLKPLTIRLPTQLKKTMMPRDLENHKKLRFLKKSTGCGSSSGSMALNHEYCFLCGPNEVEKTIPRDNNFVYVNDDVNKVGPWSAF